MHRQKDRLWEQVSGVNYASGVSQTLQKGGNTGCATLSFVPHTTHMLHMENLPKVGMENWACSENCLFGCCVLLRSWLLSWKG